MAGAANSQRAWIHTVRWKIALLLSTAIAISYVDRQTLPVAISAIQRDIAVSNTQFAQLQAAFLLAYALMYAAGGRLADAAGTRLGLLLMMVGWSLACAGHALAAGFWTLAVSRFLLGAAEGGGFPAATKAVAEWFPARERSMAMGIIHAGSSAGSVIAPPVIALILSLANWRWAFLLPAAAGLLWTVWWLRSYFPPAQHTRLTAAERECIAEVIEAQPSSKAGVQWAAVLAYPQVWGLFAAKFLYDAAFYFYLFWIPKYLFDARGFDTKSVGYFAWIPYAAHGIGGLAGGWVSSWLIRRGWPLNASRKAALGVSAAIMPVVFFVTKSPVELAILLLSLAFFGQAVTSTIIMTLPADLFPQRAVGSVAGFLGMGGSFGGIVFGLVTGYLLDHRFGYSAIFALVSSFHLIAFSIILLTVRTVREVELS